MGQELSTSAHDKRDRERGGGSAQSALWVGVPDPVLWLARRKVRLLSSSDGVLLTSRHGERAFERDGALSPAPLHTVDPALALDALQFDGHLQGVRDRMVPSLMDDQAFWTIYFSHVDAIKHEVTLDYFRALSQLQERRERVHSIWLSLWRALPLEERCQLKLCADEIARAAGLQLAELEGGVEANNADALAEYGERGAYEVVRVLLHTALAEGAHVHGFGAGGGGAEGAEDGAGSAPPQFEEALYRVWCCADPLVLQGEPKPEPTTPAAQRGNFRSPAAARGSGGKGPATPTIASPATPITPMA